MNLSVAGMGCASCPHIVEAAIGEAEGAISLAADPWPKTALVVFDDAVTTVEAITAAGADAGYEAGVIGNGS